MKIEFGSRMPFLSVAALGVIISGTLLATRVGGGAPVGVGGTAVAGADGQWTPQSSVPFLVSGTAVPVRSAMAASASGQWVPLGPGPFRYESPLPGTAFVHSGRISSIAVDPRDVAHWLIGVGNGGVWETRDSGGSWTPMTDGLPTLSIGAVAFAPSDPEIVYVATGESAGGWGLAHVGVGLLKSTNRGQVWTLLAESTFARASVRHLLVDPNDANVLLAASGRGGLGRDAGEGAPSPPPFGILKSTDGGVSWTRTVAGQATALVADPTNFNRQYAAIADQRAGTTLIARDTPGASPNGLYRSTNGGGNWSRIEGPWGAESSPTRSAVGRIEISLAPSNPNVMYASIQVPPNGGGSGTDLLGLYRTDNAWAETPTWIQVPTQATGASGYCGPGKCGYAHAISVDPRDPNTLFAGGEVFLWQCTNCGTTPVWRRSNTSHPDLHALAWAGNRLIAGNDGGVFSSTNLGATWQTHNLTLPTKMFYQGALHPSDPSFAIAGTRDFAPPVFRASTGWLVLPPPTSHAGEAEVALSTSRPETDWMVASNNGVIHRTSDGGRTVLRVDVPIDKTGTAWVAPVRKCRHNDDVFLTGTMRIWRTNDFFGSPAPTWSANSPSRPFPAPGFTTLSDPGTILSIAYIDGDRGCNSYAYGNRGGEVRLTRDGGATWIDIDPSKGLPSRPINGLAFDPNSPNRAFAALSSYDIATPGKPGHIFRTENALSSSPTWIRVGPPDVPFADMPFNAIAVDPRDPRIVYAGSDNGLWESGDGGTTWSKVGLEAGLPPASVYDIQINPNTNRTVIFTYGRGAYELSR